MATSGTFKGSRGGNSSGPWLELHWARQQTDIANNRSLIRLTLRLHADRTIRFTASKTGKLHGSSFTYTGGMTSTGSKVLRTQDVWVNHNSDGSKSQSFSASFNIAISWGGSHLSSISVSGTAHIDTIPRASTLSAFSFASNLKPSTAVNLNYTIDRKSDAFRHQIQLRDGSHVVQTWDNVSSNGSSSVQLSTASVNSLLNRMSNVTSRSLTLRVATRSGVSGGWIGSAVTRSATATVDASIKPTVGVLSVSQTGNSVSSHYLQGKSKVTANFSRSAGYGATITSSSITVRRKTTNNDVQTINSYSGTTGKAVSLSGTYEARGMARDSRGRTTHTSWAEFTVTAYSSPRITTFTVSRSSSTPTTVSISRAGTHTHLGGSNVLTYTVQRRIGTGSWTNVNTNATGTSATASFSGTSTSTGNAVTSSYDFRMVVTDKFGESTESVASVSTQRVVLDIHKNEGVGIGKIHEQGALDVGGDIFTDGLNTTGVTQETDGTMITQNNMGSFFGYSSTNTGVIVIEIPDRNIMFSADISIRSYDFNTILKVSGYTYYSSADWHSTSAIGTTNNMTTVRFRTSGANGKRYITIGADTTTWGGYLQVQVSNVQSGFNARFPSKFKVSLSSTYPGDRTSAQYPIHPSNIVSSGADSSGTWVRFDDGTQICHGVFSLSAGSISYRLEARRNFPVAFTSEPSIVMNIPWMGGGGTVEANIVAKAHNITATQWSPTVHRTGGTWSGTFSSISYIAVGRWK